MKGDLRRRASDLVPSGEEMIEPERTTTRKSRPLLTERAEEGVEVQDSGDGQVYGTRGGAMGPPRLAANHLRCSQGTN